MAYQSKHTGQNIDAGIDINNTQNNRLTTLESQVNTLRDQNIDINDIQNNRLAVLESQINILQDQILSLTNDIKLKVNKDQVFLGYGHTQIPENADLNNYQTLGSYCCSSNSSSKTLKNCPIQEAFILFVYNSVGGPYVSPPTTSKYAYFRQILIPYYIGKIYTRTIFYNDNTTPEYSSWTTI